MRILDVANNEDKELARALSEFEGQFSYPLGAGRSFRISHGSDYGLFFRAMGEAACFVAQADDGKILGTLSLVARETILPNGCISRLAYFCDLKTCDGNARGMTLRRLATHAEEWARAKCSAAYAVVMDGTPQTPDKYSGRAGIPQFIVVGKLMVLHLQSESYSTKITPGSAICEAPPGKIAPQLFNPSARSRIAPQRIRVENGAATALFEDTALAKRLITSEGEVMASAHLSCLRWQSPAAAAELLRGAATMAKSLGYANVFVAFDVQDYREMVPWLGDLAFHPAEATIFGVGLEQGSRWNINTSEI